ncbi:NAD(P)H-dependent oxidoreductase [Wenyingzhuangia sp. 1_MG-2023]|nr:NAD(P)H-dependent oxidoreductase [Wenyingzhuangia sp. 1_MG-2023]
MKKVIVFGASNSKNSINKRLAIYAGSQLENVELNVLDLNDFEMPIYSIDKEEETGFPKEATAFNSELETADGFVISFAEHNGSYTAAFKNIFDWVSRIDPKVWREKPVLFLATSPGARGGASVLETAVSRMPYQGAVAIGNYSLPSFYDHFKDGKITNSELDAQLKELTVKLQKAL